jgi:hypothetical protein
MFLYPGSRLDLIGREKIPVTPRDIPIAVRPINTESEKKRTIM